MIVINSISEISSESKELLKRFQKYSLEGIVFEMPFEDVSIVLGELKDSTTRAYKYFGGTDGFFYDYKNMILILFLDKNR